MEPNETLVYLDNQATTRLDPRVLERMLPFLQDDYGNAASRTHELGRRAEKAVTMAREHVAQLIGALPEEIVFTSGATEGNNTAIKGVLGAAVEGRRHIVTTVIEHKSILDVCRRLERDGSVSYVPVGHDGIVNADDIVRHVGPETALVSVMSANNEIGTLQPTGEIGALCHAKGVVFHSDAVQVLGKLPIDVRQCEVDLLSFSAHKLYGPKGAGALFVRRRPRVRMEPLIDGGGHERGLRSGTINVPAVVGFGWACEVARAEMADEEKRVLALREHLRVSLVERVGGVRVNGSLNRRLAGNLSVTFEDVDAEALMMGLPMIALSAGSACTSAAVTPSHVLLALGIDAEAAHSTIRFSIGRFNTMEEIDRTVAAIGSRVSALRGLRKR